MRHRTSARPTLIAIWIALLLIGGPAIAQDPNICDQPGETPDLVMGGLDSVNRFGTVDGISAYSMGTSTCNIGKCWANWFASTSDHPVFAQNLYRLERGRFEQLGQSWVAHRFFALSSLLCSPTCIPTNGTHLGVGCSSPNSPPINAGQSYLGPRSEVDPSTGIFPFPHSQFGMTGNAIYKRLQVRDDDLDPLWHPDALYFIEGHSIAADDAAAGHSSNNASYRQVLVAPAGGVFNLLLTGPTHRELPAIEAWAAFDPGVLRDDVDVPGDGRFHVGSRATPLGGGIWRYEYAVHNLDSHRAASSVSVPLPAGAVVTGPGFHDVDYHSGEPFDATDWAVTIDLQPTAGTIAWATDGFAVNPNANALRWGTLYNFRFDAAAPPHTGALTLGLFRPGSPTTVDADAIVPQPCNPNGTCDANETICGCSVDCGTHPTLEAACLDATDEDCDGLIDCLDPDCCMQGVCSDADADRARDGPAVRSGTPAVRWFGGKHAVPTAFRCERSSGR